MANHTGWLVAGAALVLLAHGAFAAQLRAPMALATPTGPGSSVGEVTVDETSGGAAFNVDLHGLPPGSHGFHVHANGSCAPGSAGGQTVPAGAAGGHFDPDHTEKHLGPEGAGHLGDLPVLQVGSDGTAKEQLLAPHIKDLSALKGHALMIHAGGDNYRDEPAPLGGGGARIACGVME